MKEVVLVLLLSSVVLGGIDIFGGSSETGEVELPEGCAWATDGRCIRCLSTYLLDGSICKKKGDNIPCDGRIPCGDAKLVVKNILSPQRVNDPTPQPRFKVIPGRNTPPDAASQRAFSGTNNQEENIDQADILKTDGTYVYTISRRTITIIRAYPVNEFQILYTHTYPNNFYPMSIFIEENFMTVFGNSYTSSNQNTKIFVYDVENKGNPTLIHMYEMEGTYMNGRKTQGFIYIVSQIQESPDRYAWLRVNSIREDISTLTQTAACIDKSTFYYDQQLQYVNILGFNLTDPTQYRAISVRSIKINILYMSSKNIFLVSNRDEKIGGGNIETVSFIQKVFVLKTILSHHACRKLKGIVHNQFSLDEFEDDQILRVATTRYSNIWHTMAIHNNVYCLNRNLRMLSSRLGIAPEERIYSARYIGYRLYLVTFKRVDPFFVIEFDTHHLNPTILGDVSITGYSGYLHLYDQTTIIGVGYEVIQQNSNLVRNGVKFSVFNVEDPSNPIVADTQFLTDRRITSLAVGEHKAFFFSKQHDLMVVPAVLNASPPFSGVLLFKVTSSSIQFRGLIDHIVSTANDIVTQRRVQRIFYIEDMLYTKSMCLLKVNNLSDFVSQKVQPLSCD